MRFDFLGQIVLGVEGPTVSSRGQQPALTVARLVLDRPSPLRRDELADLLWPGERPARWEGPARQVVSRARALLVTAGAPSTCVRSRAGRVELQLPGELEVDIECAFRETTAAEQLVRAGRFETAAELAERARARLRSPFFPTSDAAWTRQWQDRVRGQLVRALHTSADAALGAGAPARVVPLAEEALGVDPFDEVATRALMAAYEALGSRGQALTAYERCRRLLEDELRVRPAAETEAAYLALLGRAPRTAIRGAEHVRPPTRSEPLPFVGRQAELARLDVDWNAVREGDTRAVVIAGEPGIGKTRLAAEIAYAARRDAALVLWGACLADTGLPYQPFGAILEQLANARPALTASLGALAADLTTLVPELIEHQASVVPAADDNARTRLFRAVQRALDVVATEPLVIVIDDLQLADEDALTLLRYLVPTLAERPCLLVITVREAAGATAAALADIHRRLPTTTFGLRGLTVDDLVEVLNVIGVKLADDVHSAAAQLVARTTGNPFYVTQLVLDAQTTRRPFDPAAVPEAIAQLVARRLDSLEPDLRSTLALAAVAGSEFDLTTLESCSSIEPERLLDIVEALTRQRFLVERGAERFTFAHELVRDAVLATITDTRRGRLHRRLADALAASGADPALLAHHYLAAGRMSTRDATRALLEAGRAGLAHAAWSVARDQFATAAELASDTDERAAALIGLGRAQRALGNASESRIALEAALALARATGKARAAAQSALALVGGGGRGVAVDVQDADRAALLRDALHGLDDDDDVDLRVAVLGELALALVLTDAKDERDGLTQRCLREARGSNNADGLAVALLARRVALMGPAGTVERVVDGREALALPPREVAPERRLAAELGLVEDLIELGDRAGVDNALQRARALADDLAHPYWSWATTSWRALVSIIDGRFEEAEALAFAALAHQAPAEHPEAVAALGVNLVDIRLFQGRAGEMLELLQTAAEENPHIPTYRAVLALCCADSGALGGARDAFELLAARDFALPDDSNWLLAIAVLADTAATLGDCDRARTLIRLLEPYCDRHVVLNCFGGGGAYWGPVAHHVGRLEAMLGRPQQARALLERAIEAAGAMGSGAFATRSRKMLSALVEG
jgi:DNA-binding SARP family transcriptional activator